MSSLMYIRFPTMKNDIQLRNLFVGGFTLIEYTIIINIRERKFVKKVVGEGWEAMAGLKGVQNF